MSYIGREPQVGNFQVCDAISVVNGQAAYTMQVSSVNVSPETANHMLVSLNGVLQAPGSSYTVSGSTITFASNLVTGDVINFIHILGSVLDLGVPSDSTVSLAKLTATGTKNSSTFLRGDNTFAGAGITEADMFRLTADFSNTNNIISSNLERVDDATFSKIGTGMSLSSGVFTFPTTGLYIVKNFAFLQSNNNVNIALQIQVSSNSGSDYDLVSHMYGGGSFSGELNTTSYQEAFVNVTNASNFRVKFVTVGFSNASVKGDTDANESVFAFIRLGDSQ